MRNQKNISESDLLLFYQAAKVFAYPTFAEGFGIPPLEAAALRIPVLCSNKTAMKDFEFFSPYFIDFNDMDATTKKLSEILKIQNPLHLSKIHGLVQIQLFSVFTQYQRNRNPLCLSLQTATFIKVLNRHSTPQQVRNLNNS